MTIDRRTVRTLRDVRSKLRDLALAEHASTSATQLRCAELMEAARSELEQTFTSAGAALRGAQSIADLERVSQEVAAHHVLVDEASADLAAAELRTEEASRQLRQRARQMESAERLFDQTRRESAKRVHRKEQRSHDDLRRRSTRETKSPR
jgi:flagellar biosynthesis chaperone FliJ